MSLLLAIFASIAMLIMFSDARRLMAAQGYYDDYLGYEGILNRGGWRATLRGLDHNSAHLVHPRGQHI
jgi:hypothetical protein